MEKFIYTEEFTVRFQDIIKFRPASKGGTYVWVFNHKGGVDCVYTAFEYKEFMKAIFKQDSR